MTQPTYVLQEFRFQQNSGSDSAPDWEAASGVDISLAVGVANKMLLRKQTYNNNNKSGAEVWSYEYSLNGGTWTAITTSSVVVRAVAGILAFTHAYDCSNQLTNRSGVFVTDNNGYCATGTGTNYTHTAAYYSETALIFYIPDTVDVDDTDDIEIRIVEAADSIDYNSITANITVIKAGDQDIDVPDTGSGADVASVPTVVIPSQTDTGAGTDATPDVSASVPITDVGAGADAIDIPAKTLLVSDVGAGADAIAAPTASVPVTDVGAGADAIAAPTASVPVTDVGAGADAINVDDGAAAASVKVAATRVACNTATGTQTITTTDLGGLTPKAALLIATYATADGVATDHAMISIGCAVGSAERWVMVTTDEHGLGTSNTARRMTDDEIVMILDPTSPGNIEGEADFDSWVTNGIVIDWAVALGSAYLLTVIFFAGDDLSVHADSVLSMGSPTIDITAPGFEPDVVFFASVRSAVNDTTSSNLGYTFGVCANDGSDTQFSNNLSSTDAAGSADNSEATRDDVIYQNIYSGSKFSAYSCGGFDANGFTLTAEDSSGGDLLYLALNFGGAGFWLGDISTPTSTGDDAETGPGFTPQAVISGFSHSDVMFNGWNDSVDTSEVFSTGIGVATATAEFSNVITSEDLATTMNTQSLSDDVFANVQPHIGGTTDDVIGTGPNGSGSFDANGFTINYSAVDTTDSHPFWCLAIEEAAAETVKNVSDVGSGAEAIANLAVTLSVSDTGEGVMTLAPSASVPTTDVGSGTDVVDDILASITVPDSGSGADAINLAAKILAILDTANASDFISNIAVDFILPETGTGTEALVVIVSLSVSDTASGLDEIDVLKALLKEVGDTGSGTETVAITNSFTVGDTATGTDTPQITVVLSVADVGSAIDAVSVITDILKEIDDAGSGIDSLSISASLAIADVGTGTDSLQSITASLTVSDVGSAIDAVNVISAALKEVSDVGAGADAIANIAASIIVTDAGAGAEAIPISVSLAVADTASGIEAINIAIHLFKQVADIGQGTDNISTSAQVVVTDLAVATDLVNQILVQAVVQDVAGAIESIQIDTGSDYIYVTLTLSGNQSAASAGSNKTEIGLGANKSTLSV